MKVGNRRVVEYHTILMLNSETSEIELKEGGWDLKITIKFNDDAKEKNVEITGTGNSSQICFNKWTDQFGISLTTPASIAKKQDDSILYFMAMNYRVGNMNKLDLQFTQD